MSSIRDWCPDCDEMGWACKCRQSRKGASDLCTICGKPPSSHSGLEKFCLVFPTYRAPNTGGHNG